MQILEGVIMNDYETSYQEYKQSLLNDHWFIKTLHEKYRGSLRVEKDYIDENGVLWKIGVLSGVCGLCLSLFWLLEDRSDTRSIITRIVLFVIMLVFFIFAMHFGKKFKKHLGERIFYTFRYHQHFEDKVQEDKDSETKKLLEDMLKAYEYSRFRDNSARLTKEDLENFLLRVIKDTDEFKQRYQELSKYDSFAGSLRNDYYFNAEVQKDIDKYV